MLFILVGAHAGSPTKASTDVGLSDKERSELEKNALDGSHQEYLKTLGVPVTSKTPPSGRTTTGNIGDVQVMNSGPTVCASSLATFSELVTLAGRQQHGEMLRTMLLTKSIILTDGLEVKILEAAPFTKKVRVVGRVDQAKGRLDTNPKDIRIGRECWVAADAVTH